MSELKASTHHCKKLARIVFRRLFLHNVSVLVLILACELTASAAENTDPGMLTIHATGFKSSDGHAIVKLFAPGDNVLARGRWEMSAVIDNGVAEFHFDHVSPGRYALVVFHDKNDNGVIDHGLFGPSEPLGFSGGFKLGLFSGFPSFEKLQFNFSPPSQLVTIDVK